MASKKFSPEEDIPSLAGKVILMTGGTAGIGAEAIIGLAKHDPTAIYFTGRNGEAATKLIDKVKAQSPETKLVFIKCDQADLSSVVNAVHEFQTLANRIDIFIANAGTMSLHPSLSKDGYESSFATNHIAHALFVKLLLPTLLKTAEEPGADVRIVTVSSDGHRFAPLVGIAFDTLRTPQSQINGPGMRYCQSKLANLLYARALAEHYPTLSGVSIHPGVIKTGLFKQRNPVWTLLTYVMTIGKFVPVEDGALNTLWAATAPKTEFINGAYYNPVGIPGRQSKLSKDTKIAEKLWEWTEKELEQYKAQ